MSSLFIGLISGTSADGIDAALVDFEEALPKLIETHFVPYSPELRTAILDLYQPGADEINRLGEIDVIVGKQFALTAKQLLEKTTYSFTHIAAIGSHGQTIRHHPYRNHPYTLQIGDPNIIAAETRITTIADFRRRDVALGGQGAPLVPAFHRHIFSDSNFNRVIVNIGGIANITLLPINSSQPIIGYDTGPGNALLDIFAEKYLKKSYDENGNWASTGKINNNLLNSLLKDSYFHLPYPKSTGREYFNLDWLSPYLTTEIDPVDILTTLVELTARTIIHAIRFHFSQCEIYVCGGGTHNKFLMSRLQNLAEPFTVKSTQQFGINPDCVEAMAFAWLAQQTLLKKAGNITTVTGATQSAILGGVYYC